MSIRVKTVWVAPQSTADMFEGVTMPAAPWEYAERIMILTPPKKKKPRRKAGAS